MKVKFWRGTPDFSTLGIGYGTNLTMCTMCNALAGVAISSRMEAVVSTVAPLNPHRSGLKKLAVHVVGLDVTYGVV